MEKIKEPMLNRVIHLTDRIFRHYEPIASPKVTRAEAWSMACQVIQLEISEAVMNHTIAEK
jgi:hypothetical protein